MQGSPRIDELRQKFHENPRRYFAPLANEYRKAGDPEQAIAICRAHLAQQPGHMSGHVVYGQALYDARRNDEAQTVFEKALSLDPDNAIVLKHLGDIARQKGDSAEARHWYTRALDADPQDSEVAAYIAELTEPVTEPIADPVAEPAAEPVTQQAEATAEEPQDESSEDELPRLTVEDDDVAWRKTPPQQDSPFVTRTMAELYAKQGYHAAALDVYRQLALRNPDDTDIRDRIEELTGAPRTESASEPEATDVPESVSLDAPPSGEGTPGSEATPESKESSDADVGAPVDAEPFTFSELSDDSVYAPSSEDLNLTTETPEESGREAHFTETELAATGDSWDTDSWGAGFTSDENLDSPFEAPDNALETAGFAPAFDILEAPSVADTAPEPAVDESAAPETNQLDAAAAEPVVEEPVAEQPPAEEPAAPVENEPELISPEPIPAEQDSPELAIPENEEPSTPGEAEIGLDEAGAEPAIDSGFVAYSPQLPEYEDLPHFAPKGPTVREFFATLGARRPPSSEPSRSFTARSMVPSIDADADPYAASEPAADDIWGEPVAGDTAETQETGDAFSSLFPDSPVSDEDSRAAFALSGALGSAPTSPQPPEPPRRTPTAPVAAPAAAQESEEDIRRFREWLDGLAGS
jgi:tetratricopeptide (TPR) repeat protein